MGSSPSKGKNAAVAHVVGSVGTSKSPPLQPPPISSSSFDC